MSGPTDEQSSSESSLPLHLRKPVTSQDDHHTPMSIVAIEGAPDFPLFLDKLVREFCGQKKQNTLPCARSHRPDQENAKAFWYEDVASGNVLASSQYKYGRDQVLTVIHGWLKPPAIINYVREADGEIRGGKMYAVWNGVYGYETVPSVVKRFGKERSGATAVPSAQLMQAEKTPATILGSSKLPVSVSQRQAGKEADERIRLSSKRQREWQEESEDDGPAAVLHGRPNRRTSNTPRSLSQNVHSEFTEASISTASRNASCNARAGAATIDIPSRNAYDALPSAQQLLPTPISEPGMASFTSYRQGNTSFEFQAEPGAATRTAKFADCDDIVKLFNHARTAKLFRTWAEVVPLACTLNGADDEVCVMRGVPADFEEVVEAIKKWWDTRTGECVVTVKVAD